jgi:hypothetical protein
LEEREGGEDARPVVAVRREPRLRLPRVVGVQRRQPVAVADEQAAEHVGCDLGRVLGVAPVDAGDGGAAAGGAVVVLPGAVAVAAVADDVPQSGFAEADGEQQVGGEAAGRFEVGDPRPAVEGGAGDGGEVDECHQV